MNNTQGPAPNEAIWKKDFDASSASEEVADIYKIVSEKDLEGKTQFFKDEARKDLKKIVNKEGEGNDLAPLQPGAYYVRVTFTPKTGVPFVLCQSVTEILKKQAGGPDPNAFDGLISISFLVALARGTVEWDKIQEWKKRVEGSGNGNTIAQQGGPLNPPQPGSTKFDSRKMDERAFIDNWRTVWRMFNASTFTKFVGNCWIPTRDLEGNLRFRTPGPGGQDSQAYAKSNSAKKFKQDWYELLSEVWKKRTLPSQAKPPRWARIPLTDGLKIVFRDDHLGLYHKELKDAVFRSNCYDEVVKTRTKDNETLVKQLTKAQVEEAKEKETVKKARMARDVLTLKQKIEDNKWDVHFDDKAPTSTTNPPVPLLEDGQGKGWFKLSSSPFDLYDSYVSEDDWNAYMKSLGTDTVGGSAQVPRPHVPTGIYPSGALDAVQTAYDAFLNAINFQNLGPNATPQAKVDQVRTLSNTLSLKSWHKVDDVAKMGDRAIFKKCAGGVRFSSTLDYRKIEVAAGERDTEFDQNTIMGGQSASTVASSLEWRHNNQPGFKTLNDRNDNQMKSTFYIAEWLHLRAYSWGGHVDSREYQGVTSQNPLNLVLGTSETNSRMLRYEKAWQNLFIFEHELYTILGEGDRPTGKLWIRTNCPTGDDSLTEDTPALAGWGDLHVVERDLFLPASMNNHDMFAQDFQTVTPAMLALTAKYPWIAHSIAYHLNMTTPSYALNRAGATKALRFYPFGRSFYHRAESILDSLLFAELKRLARLKAVGTLSNSNEDEMKKKKILGDSYKPPHGRPNNQNPPSSQSGGSQSQGGPTKGGSKKKRNGYDGLNQPLPDMVGVRTPDTTDTMPDAEETASKRKGATRYKLAGTSKPRPRDMPEDGDAASDLETDQFEPQDKKWKDEGGKAKLHAEQVRQQSFSVLKSNFRALQAEETLSKKKLADEVPKLADGKRAAPSETRKNPVQRVIGNYPDYIPYDGLTASMAKATAMHQQQLQSMHVGSMSGFVQGRDRFLHDSQDGLQNLYPAQDHHPEQENSYSDGGNFNTGNHAPFTGIRRLEDLTMEQYMVISAIGRRHGWPI